MCGVAYVIKLGTAPRCDDIWAHSDRMPDVGVQVGDWLRLAEGPRSPRDDPVSTPLDDSPLRVGDWCAHRGSLGDCTVTWEGKVLELEVRGRGSGAEPWVCVRLKRSPPMAPRWLPAARVVKIVGPAEGWKEGSFGQWW